MRVAGAEIESTRAPTTARKYFSREHDLTLAIDIADSVRAIRVVSVKAFPAFQRVVARIALEQVGTQPGSQHIVARIAEKGIGPGAA